MPRAVEHRPASAWPSAEAAGSLTLDYHTRHRRRIRLTTDAGAELLLDLPKAVAMAHGDGLLLDDGRWLCVKAAAEALIEVRADDPALLARIAWHIGNRHTPAQIAGAAIRIRPDHVLEAMVAGLGGLMTRIEAPFQPEGGAYAGAGHGHANGHDPRHDHRQDHGHDGDSPDHDHDHPHDAAHPHKHDR